ncbi:lanthionine synthetase LanC family protein [Pedobacter sp. ISL-64]|uniref:lanthionine synthetase LanC family protein n=1 Tax=Pedobacter sp. ISL-64 TaxID=2819164 RepID=UPI001BEA2392|nr:lanthionine synthetase LanC family protein [Pedobacter sp. ISL-64]MBT2562525.1 hypothetical protein [Pedobacter sp. ISL-64]
MTEINRIYIEKIKNVLDSKGDVAGSLSYETGLLGKALFYFYYARYTNDTSYIDKAQENFSDALSALDLENFKPLYRTDSLDSHLAHLGRFITFCNDNGFLELDDADYLSKIDDVLFSLMESKISSGNFDLNNGALAAGYHYLSRYPKISKAGEHLGRLVKGILEKAKTDLDGDCFWELPVMGNRVYLGISHGSALIISFLVNVYEKGIEKEICAGLIKKASHFVLKQKFRFEKGLFPNYIGDVEDDRKQFSLCYGDIGIGYALYRAGDILGENRLKLTAQEILDDCLERKREDRLTLDASIIYGAAGLAETFDKLYRLNQDLRFKKASEYWYNSIPSYAIHNDEYAGYKTRINNAGDLWNISFGWGIIGIGISLMRSEDNKLPPIDALLSVA